MDNRAFVFVGSVAAGTVWIVMLSAMLWNTPAGHQGAALLLDLHTTSFRYPFTIQNVMWIVFFIGFGELLTRHAAGGAEARQLGKKLLPEDPKEMLRRQDLAPVYGRICASDPDGKFWLQRLLTSVILQFQSNGAIDQVNAVFTSLVELYQHEIELRYNMLRYLVWLIPTLGFIGTVVGIALALGEAGTIFAGAGSGRTPDPSAMTDLTQKLGVTFFTTLLALLQSAVLMAAMHVVQGREERALNRAGQYCLRNLVNRLYEQR